MTQIKYQQTVAVCGATGAQGGAAVRALLHNGHRVRALTRDPSSAAAETLRTLGAQVAHADFDDPDSLHAALTGADALFAMSTPFGTDLDTEVRQGFALLDAAAAVGSVSHVVFTSAVNANRSTGIPHFDSKQRIEEHLRTLDLVWTVLGPGVFMDNYANGWTLQSLREGYLALPMPADQPLPLIAAQDIGAFAALAFDRPGRFGGRRFDIAAQWATPREIADAIATASGKPIGYREVPLATAETYSADLAAMFRYFQETGLEIDVPELRWEFPEVEWCGIADWAARQTWDLDAG